MSVLLSKLSGNITRQGILGENSTSLPHQAYDCRAYRGRFPLQQKPSFLVSNTSWPIMSYKDHSVPLVKSPTTSTADDLEAAKKRAAQEAVKDNYNPSFELIGIGSGSTVVYVVDAIKAAGADASSTKFVPTGTQSRNVILDAGLHAVSFDSLLPGTLLDICFDGADEVDEELNCIKGGGACLYQEKLVATHSRRFICVADHRKRQSRLLTNWPTIPIEVEPLAAGSVITLLNEFGARNAQIRHGKNNLVRTDQNNYIIDAPFPKLLLPRDLTDTEKGDGKNGVWEVKNLAQAIKMTEGVLSVGIFSGENGDEAQGRDKKRGGEKPVAAYFGMKDQTVILRKAGKEDVAL
jgi:ribose 5-phosphate isomerase A